MSKKMSLVIACAIFAASINPNLTYASVREIEIIESSTGLDYVGNKIGNAPLEKDQVSFKLSTIESGVYKVEYFIEAIEQNVSKTYKVVIELFKDFEYKDNKYSPKHNNMVVKLHLEDKDENSIPLIYSTHDYPYENNWTSTNKQEDFITNLKIGVEDLVKEKSLGIKLGKYSHMKFVYNSKNNEVSIVVDKINKGNITDFDLYYDSSKIEENDKPMHKMTIFKGLDGFEITPTHLYVKDGDLKSLNIIDNLGEVAGSKPGVKVRFERPKKVKDNEFVYTEDDDNLTAVLKLSSEFKGDVSEEDEYQNLLNFEIEDNAPIFKGLTGTSNETNGNVVMHKEGDTEYVDTYYSKYKIDNRLHQWDYLTDGLIIDGSIELSGDLINNVKNNSYSPENIGHTYINYNVSRLGLDDIMFKIRPYKIDGNVTYKLQKSTNPNANDSNWHTVDIRHYDKYTGDTITLTINNKTEAYYRVLIEVGSNDSTKNTSIKSQVIKYNPNNEHIPVSPTEITQISNLTVIPNEEGTDAEHIKADITWRAPDKEILTNLILNDDKLYYELYLHGPNGERTPIKVFKVESLDGEIKIEPYAGSAGAAYYNKEAEEFIIRDVIFKESADSKWENLKMPSGYLYDGTKDYPEIGKDGIEVEKALDYRIPGNYKLSLVAVYDYTEDIPLRGSAESKLEAMTLDFSKEIINTPSIIMDESIVSNGKVESTITFNNIDLRNYVSTMLNPIGATLANGYDRTYEVYLYTDKDLSGKDLSKYAIDGKLEYNENGIQVNTEYLNKDEKVHLVEVENGLNDEKTAIKFTGLDINQNYYVQIRVRLHPLDKDGKNLKDRYSVYSKVHTFIHSGKPLPPDANELTPESPSDFKVSLTDKNVASLLWKPVNEDTAVDETYYEVIRTEGYKLAGKELDKNKSLESLVAEGNKYVAFKTNEEYVTVYKNGTWTPMKDFLSSENTFNDAELKPNKLYYYYIRTVNKLKGEEVRSEWIYDSITTNPMGKPIKLKVEDAKDYPYNTKTSTVISFLAPIPSDGIIPDEYDFEIVMRSSDDTDFVKVDRTKLIEKDEHTSADGYRKIVYKIEGLKHGSSYDIKVRVIDKTQSQVDSEYTKSLYSDPVNVRTDIDEEEAEKEHKFDQYLEKFDSEVNRLRLTPYWATDSTDHGYNVFAYRGDYTQSVVEKNKSISLASIEDAEEYTYYLPISLLDEMSRLNTSLYIELEHSKLTLRPNSLSRDTEAIKEALKELGKSKNNDFYVMVRVQEKDTHEVINGNKALSPKVYLDFDIAYTDRTEEEIDEKILAKLESRIARERDNFIEDLEKIVMKGKRLHTDDIDDLIESSIDSIKYKHTDDIEKVLDDVLHSTDKIDTLNMGVLLGIENNNNIVRAYMNKKDKWESVTTFKYDKYAMIDTKSSGVYVLTNENQNIVQDGISEHLDFISKYQLSDVLNLSPYGIHKNITNGELYNAVARVLGADVGLDGSSYLVQMGIKGVNKNTLNRDAKNCDVIYIVMQAHERAYNTNLKALQIPNKQSVKNIGSFQTPHRQYVYSAVLKGIVDTNNGSVSVNAPVSTEQLIKIMSKALY